MAAGVRVAVVTGGSRGIGRGIVGELAGRGFAVVVNYRSDLESAESACREARERGAPLAVAIGADVADLDQGRSLVERTLSEFGRVDVWVNNAGIAPAVRLDLLETTPESWDRLLATNLRGPFFLTQAVAKQMVRLRAEGTIDDPQIVFITSVSSTFASVSRGEYCVSKAGLSMVARLFATRLAGEGIRVNEVRPGIIDTDLTHAVRDVYDRRIGEGLVPIPRWGLPADVGRAVAALVSDAFAFTTGEVVHVDGGLHMPRL